jgi:hypothetical protein
MSVLARIAGGLKRAFEPAQRIDLDVPFAQKDEAKRLGAHWDPQQKIWFINSKYDQAKFDKWLPDSPANQRCYLDVPFEDKDKVRSLGGIWDNERRSWYFPGGAAPEPFARWLPVIKAVLIDPYNKSITELFLPAYKTDEIGEPVDPAQFEKTSNAMRHALDPEGERFPTAFTLSLSDGCAALIEDFGLVRSDAAYWELNPDFFDCRIVRGGRYLIYGFDGSPTEASLPPHRQIGFWKSMVLWVNESDAQAWMEDHGIERLTYPDGNETL